MGKSSQIHTVRNAVGLRVNYEDVETALVSGAFSDNLTHPDSLLDPRWTRFLEQFHKRESNSSFADLHDLKLLNNEDKFVLQCEECSQAGTIGSIISFFGRGNEENSEEENPLSNYLLKMNFSVRKYDEKINSSVHMDMKKAVHEYYKGLYSSQRLDNVHRRLIQNYQGVGKLEVIRRLRRFGCKLGSEAADAFEKFIYSVYFPKSGVSGMEKLKKSAGRSQIPIDKQQKVFFLVEALHDFKQQSFHHSTRTIADKLGMTVDQVKYAFNRYNKLSVAAKFRLISTPAHRYFDSDQNLNEVSEIQKDISIGFQRSLRKVPDTEVDWVRFPARLLPDGYIEFLVLSQTKSFYAVGPFSELVSGARFFSKEIAEALKARFGPPKK